MQESHGKLVAPPVWLFLPKQTYGALWGPGKNHGAVPGQSLLPLLSRPLPLPPPLRAQGPDLSGQQARPLSLVAGTQV